MEQVANFFSHLPVTDPILIFSLVLFVILIAPLALDRLKIPHIIGLILAGVILSENCTGVLKRDVSFDLFGTVGLLYIMFLAGLQMDLADFKKNTKKNVFFGLTTFYVPMIFGSVSSFFLLKYLFAHTTPEFQTIGNFSFTGYLILASVLIGIDTLLVRKTETDRQEALRLGDVDFTGQNYMLQKPGRAFFLKFRLFL